MATRKVGEENCVVAWTAIHERIERRKTPKKRRFAVQNPVQTPSVPTKKHA
jgi:hypothetical protein